ALGLDEWSRPGPGGGLRAAAARKLGGGAPASASVYAAMGETGAAAPLLGALGSLDAGRTVAVVGCGGGRATGIVINADGPVPGAAAIGDAWAGGLPTSYAEALRARGQLEATGETTPMGVPPESALFVRGAEEMLG